MDSGIFFNIIEKLQGSRLFWRVNTDLYKVWVILISFNDGRFYSRAVSFFFFFLLTILFLESKKEYYCDEDVLVLKGLIEKERLYWVYFVSIYSNPGVSYEVGVFISSFDYKLCNYVGESFRLVSSGELVRVGYRSGLDEFVRVLLGGRTFFNVSNLVIWNKSPLGVPYINVNNIVFKAVIVLEDSAYFFRRGDIDVRVKSGVYLNLYLFLLREYKLLLCFFKEFFFIKFVEVQLERESVFKLHTDNFVSSIVYGSLCISNVLSIQRSGGGLVMEDRLEHEMFYYLNFFTKGEVSNFKYNYFLIHNQLSLVDDFFDISKSCVTQVFICSEKDLHWESREDGKMKVYNEAVEWVGNSIQFFHPKEDVVGVEKWTLPKMEVVNSTVPFFRYEGMGIGKLEYREFPRDAHTVYGYDSVRGCLVVCSGFVDNDEYMSLGSQKFDCIYIGFPGSVGQYKNVYRNIHFKKYSSSSLFSRTFEPTDDLLFNLHVREDVVNIVPRVMTAPLGLFKCGVLKSCELEDMTRSRLVLPNLETEIGESGVEVLLNQYPKGRTLIELHSGHHKFFMCWGFSLFCLNESCCMQNKKYL